MRVRRAFRARLAPRTAGLRKELILQPVREFNARLRAVVWGDRAPSSARLILLSRSTGRWSPTTGNISWSSASRCLDQRKADGCFSDADVRAQGE